MLCFEFATAPRILFGASALRDVGPIAKGLGHRALILTGRSAGRASALNRLLGEHEIARIEILADDANPYLSIPVVRVLGKCGGFAGELRVRSDNATDSDWGTHV